MNVQPADEIAKQYWGDDVPDWVMRLAEQCMASSQNQVAKNLGYSASVVNQVLRHKYADLVAAGWQVGDDEIKRDAEQLLGVRDGFRRYLRMDPQARDREYVESYIRELEGGGR